MTFSKFYYSGPLLYHTELNKNDLSNLKKICVKDKTKDYKKYLAGHLEHEYLIDKKNFTKIINNYLPEYKKVFQHWYNKEIINFETTAVWVNFMKKGDSNPIHTHDEDLSCVLYLEIPTKLQEENKKFIGNASGPGSINFIFHALGNKNLNINTKHHFPKTGDFFIFPSFLMHSVDPFKSNVERISVSANFKITTT